MKPPAAAEPLSKAALPDDQGGAQGEQANDRVPPNDDDDADYLPSKENSTMLVTTGSQQPVCPPPPATASPPIASNKREQNKNSPTGSSQIQTQVSKESSQNNSPLLDENYCDYVIEATEEANLVDQAKAELDNDDNEEEEEQQEAKQGSMQEQAAGGHLQQQCSPTSLQAAASSRRTSIAARERRLLESHFERLSRPTSEQLQSIAEKLDMDKNTVRVWFCNQRQKQKRLKYSSAATSAAVTPALELGTTGGNEITPEQRLTSAEAAKLLVDQAQHSSAASLPAAIGSADARRAS